MKKLMSFLSYFLPAFLFLSFWEFYTHRNQKLQFLFAAPSLVASTAFEEFTTGEIWTHIFTTSLEAALGLLAGTILGTFFGLLLWTNESLAKIARPYIVLLGSVPIFAVAPMLIIWFGTGLLSKVIMAAFAVFFVALSQSYDGAKYCYIEHGLFAKTLSAPHSLVIQKIIIPGALRWVTAGLKISIGLALVGAFIGEFVSSEAGLGHYILTAGSLYDMPRVIFGVFLISILALFISFLVWLVEQTFPQMFVK